MDSLEKNPVQDQSLINDIRTPTDFRGISFSKYKRTEAIWAEAEFYFYGKKIAYEN